MPKSPKCAPTESYTSVRGCYHMIASRLRTVRPWPHSAEFTTCACKYLGGFSNFGELRTKPQLEQKTSNLIEKLERPTTTTKVSIEQKI